VNHESIGFSGLEKHKGTEGGMESFGEAEEEDEEDEEDAVR
jgi:hypothetical protein